MFQAFTVRFKVFVSCLRNSSDVMKLLAFFHSTVIFVYSLKLGSFFFFLHTDTRMFLPILFELFICSIFVVVQPMPDAIFLDVGGTKGKRQADVLELGTHGYQVP